MFSWCDLGGLLLLSGLCFSSVAPQSQQPCAFFPKTFPLTEWSYQESHGLSYRNNFLRTEHPPICLPLGAVTAALLLGIQITPTLKTTCCKCFFITPLSWIHPISCYNFTCQYCCGKYCCTISLYHCTGKAVVFGAPNTQASTGKKS